MERMRDLVDADDQAVAELARLVRATGELDPAPGAQDRVREALAEPRRVRLRAPLWALVAGLAIVAIVAGRQKLVALDPAVERPGVAVVAAPPRPTPPQVAPSEVRTAPPVARLAPAQPPASALAAGSAPAQLLGPAEVAGNPRSDEPAPKRGRVSDANAVLVPRIAATQHDRAPAAPDVLVTDIAPVAPPPPLPPPEAAVVLRALRLLHHDRDARAALRELDDYRARFPAGDLVEEVLALAIEARAALDDAAARPLADQYLHRFPHGRFRAVAEHAQQRFAGR
jgi:hypothetical protein